MRVTLVPLAILVASVLLPSPEAHAAYAQRTFQIGGIVTDIPADTTLLQRISDAGIDWVSWYGWHYATLPGAADVTARAEELRTHHAGFAMKVLAFYKADPGDPPRLAPGRLFLNRDHAPSRADIDSTLSPTHGIDGPSTLGYAIWDEPDTNDALAFTNIGLISRWIAANPNSANKLAFTNLFSSSIRAQAVPDASFSA
ncbi:MAG TPA: hypothetical protein VNM39_09875, partial [Verrucomicrobiae bacterium]|nr:hypothetical protein [Verrucomicrobiae bacterium]